MPNLIVIEGYNRGQVFPISDREIILGRDASCEICLEDDRISRRHARLKWGNGKTVIQDTESRNGIKVNGVKCEHFELSDGDEIQLGRIWLRFVDEAPSITFKEDKEEIIGVTTEYEIPRDFIESRLWKDKKASFYLSEIFKIEASLRDSENVKELASRILNFLISSLNCVNGAVYLGVSPSSFKPAAYIGTPEVSKSLMERVLKNERHAVILQNSGVANKGSQDSSSMFIPIPGKKSPIGILYLDRLAKPFDETDLHFGSIAVREMGFILETMVERETLESENRQLIRSISRKFELIGKSKSMNQVIETINKVAPTELPVLIEGETGTGKELVARAIHMLSPRRDKPFVPVNCAELRGSLLEDELFGHEKGAFTGALAIRKGIFEMAHHGTMFLDELGEMSLECQAGILRALETKEIRRVGGTTSIETDVRVLAATNQDLVSAVKDGKFREDLYYRLKVVEIHLAPLREREEDIPVLAEFFLKRYAPDREFSKDFSKAIQKYRFPGNIRELKNLIERITIFSGSHLISENDLPPEYKTPEESTNQVIPLSEVIKTHILEALKITEGNKGRTAELLQVDRKTLYNKLKEYKIEN